MFKTRLQLFMILPDFEHGSLRSDEDFLEVLKHIENLSF